MVERSCLVVLLLVVPLLAACQPDEPPPPSPYVVELTAGSDPRAVARSVGARPTHAYRKALVGFSAKLTPSQVESLQANPSTVAVIPDAVAAKVPDEPTVPATDVPQFVTTGVRRVGGLESPTAKIDGIDERVDVDIAIVDTGVDSHPDLNLVGGTACGAYRRYDDIGDHGTATAGFAGAIDNNFGAVGVAPGSRLWSVNVVNKGNAVTFSALLCGVEWLAQNSSVIEIANMSIIGQSQVRSCDSIASIGARGIADLLHDAVCDVVASGITVVAAAGNAARSVDGSQVPAAYPEVITVSALADSDGRPGGLGGQPMCVGGPVPETDDHFASFSNFGEAIDIAAPGVCISSTYTDGRYATLEGTSFSSPLVAGGAALYLANNPGATPAQVREALLARAEPGPIPGDPDQYPEGVLNVRGL